MRKLSHKRALNQQSLDIFFKPKKEVDLTITIPDGTKTEQTKSMIQNFFLNHTQNSNENTKYEPIITYSDFEIGCSTDEDETQNFVSNRASSFNRNIKNLNPVQDDDSDFEKDDESDENYYNDSQVSSPTIITRHQELEKKKEKVNIFTPTWNFTNLANEREDKKYPHIRFDLNSMCNIHYQLEVIEKRIQNGDDEEHEHPAMCVQVLDEEGISEVTDEEKKLRGSYDEIEFDKIKPSFWEPRCYDDEYSQLTKNDNRNLQNVICLANDAESDEIVTWEPEDDLIPPRNPIQHFTTNIQNSEEMINDTEDFNIKDTSKSSSPRFIFVNSSDKKVPQISFVYKGQKFNSKKTLKSPEINNTKKERKEKEPIPIKPKIEKKAQNKQNEKKTLLDFVKEDMDKQPIARKNSSKRSTKPNLFEESDSDYFTDSDSTISESESALSSALDSSDENENAIENENDIENDASNIAEPVITKKQPIISKQKLLRLSSLLFDTDFTDSETDLEDF